MGGSTQVIPTTQNTQQQVQIPAYLQQAGQTAVDKATDFSNTPWQQFSGQTVAPLSDNQNSAADIAANSTGVGQDYLGAAGANLGTGSTALSTAGTVANDTATAGMDSAGLGAQLAKMAGTSAATNQNVGAADLAQANAYNAASAAPVSGTDIASYFNPYVQQSLDPVIANLTRSAGQTQAGIQSKAAMSGAFGDSREGLEESQNNKNLGTQIATTTGQGYDTAYNDALAAAQAQQATYGKAANTAITGSGQANVNANDALSRLTGAAASNDAAGTTASDLATASQQRFLNLVNPSVSLAGANQNLATTASGLTNDSINRLLTTGGLSQTYQQNVDNSAYQQYLNQQNYALTQLNALIAAAGGTPYGTSTTSNTQGTQVVQTPSILGQLAGAAGTVAGAAIASNRDWKEDFGEVDDEDILSRFRNLGVETYRYKPEVREAIGDDGRVRIGPMAQDYAREFGGDGKTIPMPEILGELVSAVRALDRRTAAPRDELGNRLAALAA